MARARPGPAVEARPPIRVLVVDDSAVVRQVLSAQLGAAPGIEVLGCAPDPIIAMRRMNEAWPDVVVLDIEMPRMDGISFLKRIMALRPTPVVICSTLTQRGAETTMEALAAGAVSVVPKPTVGLKRFLEDDSGDIIAAVRAGAASRVSLRRPVDHAVSAPAPSTHPWAASAMPHTGSRPSLTTDRVVAIGTSTGGTQALEAVLPRLTRVDSGTVVVQHMPEQFTEAFARRLDTLCEVEVREAKDQDRVLPGLVLIAPGGRHMELRRDGAHYRVRVFDAPPVNRHRPSVDVLFRSVARWAGRNALGVLMTGMGDDGARGLLEMHQAGASTIAQDEATSVVYGMPREAVLLGAVDRELPLGAIAGVIRSRG